MDVSKGGGERVKEWAEVFQNEFYVLQQSPDQITILIDPLLLRDLEGLIKDQVSYQVIDQCFNFFELLGNHSLLLIKKFCSKYSAHYSRALWDYFNPDQYPDKYDNLIKLEYKEGGIRSEPFEANTANKQEFENSKKKFIKFYMNFREENLFPEFSANIAESSKIKDQTLTLPENEIEQKIDFLSDEKRDIHIYLRIVQVKHTEIYKVLLLSNAGTGNFVMKNLVRQNALLIGKQEYDFILRSKMQFNFP